MSRIEPQAAPHLTSILDDSTKRVELMEIALDIMSLAIAPPSTVVTISQTAIDKLAQDIGSL